jgi:hypothetical protein
VVMTEQKNIYDDSPHELTIDLYLAVEGLKHKGTFDDLRQEKQSEGYDMVLVEQWLMEKRFIIDAVAAEYEFAGDPDNMVYWDWNVERFREAAERVFERMEFRW